MTGGIKPYSTIFLKYLTNIDVDSSQIFITKIILSKEGRIFSEIVLKYKIVTKKTTIHG